MAWTRTRAESRSAAHRREEFVCDGIVFAARDPVPDGEVRLKDGTVAQSVPLVFSKAKDAGSGLLARLGFCW